MRVLVVDDDAKTVAFVQRGLKELGFVLDSCGDPHDALEYALHDRYDIIVLDMMLPGMHGTALVREMRGRGVKAPVLAVTALGGTEDRVAGLDAGCDDYLVKPFAFSELAARIRALGRRSEVFQRTNLAYAGVEMDTSRRAVTREGRKIDLSNKEFALLTLFLREPERVFAKAEILDRVWGANAYTASNVLEVYVKFLRKKIDDRFTEKLIHTVRGVGYTMRSDAPHCPTSPAHALPLLDGID